VLCAGGCATVKHPITPAAPSPGVLESRVGLASYYGAGFQVKVAANGGPFDMNAMVAAHPAYPFGTLVRVTNLTNGRWVHVRIVDQGPAPGPQAAGVIIDLSRHAAQALGLIKDGRARVRIEVPRRGEQP
jgi:rare lipoprotein A